MQRIWLLMCGTMKQIFVWFLSKLILCTSRVQKSCSLGKKFYDGRRIEMQKLLNDNIIFVFDFFTRSCSPRVQSLHYTTCTISNKYITYFMYAAAVAENCSSKWKNKYKIDRERRRGRERENAIQFIIHYEYCAVVFDIIIFPSVLCERERA